MAFWQKALWWGLEVVREVLPRPEWWEQGLTGCRCAWDRPVGPLKWKPTGTRPISDQQPAKTHSLSINTLPCFSINVFFAFCSLFQYSYVNVQKRKVWKLCCSNLISLLVNDYSDHLRVCYLSVFVWVCVLSSYFTSHFRLHESSCVSGPGWASKELWVLIALTPWSIVSDLSLCDEIRDILTLMLCHLNRRHSVFDTAKQAS